MSQTRSESKPAAVGGTLTAEDREWVLAAQDATELNRDRLHAAYMRFFLEGDAPAPADGDADDDADSADAANAASDDDDDDADLRARLRGGHRGDDSDEGGEGDDWDAILDQAEADDAARDEDLKAANDEFMQWITTHDTRLDEPTAPADRQAQSGELVSRRLEARGFAGGADATATSTAGGLTHRPERLQELYVAGERAEGFAPRVAPESEVRLDRLKEVEWIVARLRERPGMPLHGAAIHPRDMDRITWEVEQAVQLLVDDAFEPAYIAMYFPHVFNDLKRFSWPSDAPGLATASDASMPYCALTGRRVDPRYSAARQITFAIPNGDRECDGAWSSTAITDIQQGTDDAVRAVTAVPDVIEKPLDVRLGRLIWHIAEQHARCTSLERQRQELLRRLDACGDFAMRRVLAAMAFTSPHHSLAWRQYADWRRAASASASASAAALGGGSSDMRSAESVARARGYANAVDTFAVDTVRLAEALANDTQVPSMRPHDATPEVWAARFAVGGDTAAEVLDVCRRAIVERLAALPPLREACYEACIASGVLALQPLGGARVAFPKYVRVRTLLAKPSAILELLEEEAARHVRIELVTPAANVRAATGLDRWIDASTGGAVHGQRQHQAASVAQEAWRDALGDAANLALQRLQRHAETQVRNALRIQGEEWHIATTVGRLGHLCAVGGYERTALNITAFPAHERLWEGAWDIAEAVPAGPTGIADPVYTANSPAATGIRAVPVCGAFRAPSGATYFAVVDAFGALKATCKWIDCAVGTAEGAAEAHRQQRELLQVLRALTPEVISVAVHGKHSSKCIGDVSKFLREHVRPELGIDIAVVYHAPTVAAVAARSAAAATLMPGLNEHHRMAACVARATQSPLGTIARLFDPDRSARDLPIGSDRFRHAGQHCAQRLYRWLEWEMSLWVSAAGVDVNATLAAHSPELVLQFVAGLGPRRSRQLVAELNRSHGARIGSRKQLRDVCHATLSDDGQAAVIARNCLSSLRVVALDSPATSGDAHPLDATLVPMEWYDAVAAWLAPRRHVPRGLGPIVILDTMVRSRLDARRAVYMASRDAAFANDRLHEFDQAPHPELPSASVLASMRDFYVSEHHLLGAEVAFARFATGQLLAGPRPTQLRPFRAVTKEAFFELTTSLAYSPRDIGGRPAAPGASVVHKGQLVEGTIKSVRANPKSGDVSITLALSLGVFATLSTRDVDSPPLRAALEAYGAVVKGNPTARVRPEHEALTVGETMFARVVDVQYDRAELRVRWVDAPDPQDLRDAVSSMGGSSRGSVSNSHLSDAGATVNTEALVRRGQATALGFVKHPLFRDLRVAELQDLMASSALQIGEVVVRRSHVGGGAFVIAVKVEEAADSCVFSIPCTEVRDARGHHVYRIDHPRLVPRPQSNGAQAASLFESLDHIVKRKVTPIVQHVRQIRTHRKFLPSDTLARESIVAQLNEDTDRLAYALTPRLDERSGAHYAILYQTSAMAQPHAVPIAFLGETLGYPERDRRGQLSPCGNISRVIQRFKAEHTRALRQHSGSAQLPSHQHPASRGGSGSAVRHGSASLGAAGRLGSGRRIASSVVSREAASRI